MSMSLPGHVHPALTYKGGGRLLQDLLVAALNRTLPLPKGDDVPLTVPKDLDLNVACMLHVLLYKNACIPKVGLALPAGAPGQGSCLCCRVDTIQLGSCA